MFLSFVYVSNRTRSIDLLARGLSSSPPADPGWELVVVDGVPARVASGRAPHHLRDCGIPVGWYGPPRAQPQPNAVTGFVSAMNSGLLRCRGDHVVFLHDYEISPPGAPAAWAGAFRANPRTLIHGSADVYAADPPDTPDDEEIRTWLGDYPGLLVERWVPGVFEVGYWGGPMAYFEATNGIDCRADLCSEWALACVMAQAKIHGYALKVIPELSCVQFDHRAWHAGGDGGNSGWKTWGHFRGAAREPEWTGWSCNDFNMAGVLAIRRGMASEGVTI